MKNIGEELYQEQELPVGTISHRHISATMDHDEPLLLEWGMIMEAGSIIVGVRLPHLWGLDDVSLIIIQRVEASLEHSKDSGNIDSSSPTIMAIKIVMLHFP